MQDLPFRRHFLVELLLKDFNPERVLRRESIVHFNITRCGF